MTRWFRFAGCVAAAVGAAVVARAQEPPRATPPGLESHSRPAEIAKDTTPTGTPEWGPTPADQVGFLKTLLSRNTWFDDLGLRTYGWVEGGYTGASFPGHGPLSVQPKLNRFGNEFLLNQMAVRVMKPLAQDRADWGFNVLYDAGADAATGQPKGGLDDPASNARFSHDLRDLYLSAHLPVLTAGGVNLKVGRMDTIIGWNGYLAPNRPFYSSDYQFFYSQDGAFTGGLAQVVVSDQLDVWNGVTLGANTFFTKRSQDSVCYIGQVNYWLTGEKRTRLTASTYVGPDAILAAPGLAGDFVSMVELRVEHQWADQLTQVVQSNFGWDRNTPVGTGSWFGVYTVGILHLNALWDVQSRAEWFRDVRGTRTGIDTNYSEVTLGVNYHPTAWLEFRPEVRGDFAGQPAFGLNGAHTDRNQLTVAASFLVKF